MVFQPGWLMVWHTCSEQRYPLPASSANDVAALSRLSAPMFTLKFQPGRLMAWLYQPIFPNQEG